MSWCLGLGVNLNVLVPLMAELLESLSTLVVSLKLTCVCMQFGY